MAAFFYFSAAATTLRRTLLLETDLIHSSHLGTSGQIMTVSPCRPRRTSRDGAAARLIPADILVPAARAVQGGAVFSSHVRGAASEPVNGSDQRGWIYS